MSMFAFLLCCIGCLILLFLSVAIFDGIVDWARKKNERLTVAMLTILLVVILFIVFIHMYIGICIEK